MSFLKGVTQCSACQERGHWVGDPVSEVKRNNVANIVYEQPTSIWVYTAFIWQEELPAFPERAPKNLLQLIIATSQAALWRATTTPSPKYSNYITVDSERRCCRKCRIAFYLYGKPQLNHTRVSSRTKKAPSQEANRSLPLQALATIGSPGQVYFDVLLQSTWLAHSVRLDNPCCNF